MPLYRCTYPEGTLDDAQRASLAVAFTDIHCELTGAPRTFVHVQFHPRAPRPDGPRFELHAGIRAGRDRALADALIARCIAAVAQATGAAASEITMRTSATPASWILEGGRVLPEPGEEDDWVAGASRAA
jgi:phenylpyruvate tautomerase PptA (4-oxalocrotonate tautomerase family)